MRVLMINSVCGIRSTGRICADLAKQYIQQGHEVMVAYGREYVPSDLKSISVSICDKKSVYINAFKARLFDNEGFNCKRSTKKFIKWAEEYNPDLVWLHNLHGYYINIEMLFDWIKSRPHMQVKWTLHDCWAFTGHCPHFSMAKCNKWMTHCEKCTQKGKYPISYFVDNSSKNFSRKEKAFNGVDNMIIVTPSKWLKRHVEKSFLKEYPIEVAYNTIDVETFRPTKSNFKKKMGLQGKKIILGVAAVWDERKGLDDFIAISQKIDDSYAIVLVGLTKKQAKKMPINIIAVERTDSKKELADIYTSADIFINPSKEETFGLTTLEALSCGTKAIVYRGTACEEVVSIYGNGVAVENSVEALIDEIGKFSK